MKATKKCQFCGKPFVTRSGMQRYCSEACQAEAKRASPVVSGDNCCACL